MISDKITITPELAIRVGALAEHYQDASVEIAYDDDRPEQVWQVTFDIGTEVHRYLVNDETGIAKPDTSYYVERRSTPWAIARQVVDKALGS